MNPRIIAMVLCVAAFLLIYGCTGHKEAVKTYRFRFTEELPSRRSATVMKKKESHTTVEFLSVNIFSSDVSFPFNSLFYRYTIDIKTEREEYIKSFHSFIPGDKIDMSIVNGMAGMKWS